MKMYLMASISLMLLGSVSSAYAAQLSATAAINNPAHVAAVDDYKMPAIPGAMQPSMPHAGIDGLREQGNQREPRVGDEFLCATTQLGAGMMLQCSDVV